MFVKNASYEVLQAVIKNDDYVSFQPQEVKEVSDELGKHFLERYPITHMVEVFEAKKEEVVVEPEKELEPKVEKVVDTNTKCPICGKVARTNAGLKVHMKSHS